MWDAQEGTFLACAGALLSGCAGTPSALMEGWFVGLLIFDGPPSMWVTPTFLCSYSLCR